MITIILILLISNLLATMRVLSKLDSFSVGSDSELINRISEKVNNMIAQVKQIIP